MLASGPGRPVSVDTIVDALWGDDPPPSAAKTIQSHVMRLPRSLADAGGDVLETVPGGYYRLNVDPAAVDAVLFEELAADGRRELGAGNAVSAVERLEEAMLLWRGPAYAEFRDSEFALAEGARLSELRSAAEEDLADARLAIGEVATVVADLERLVVEEPGRERAWALLMRALYAGGRQQHALAAYRRARLALADGFGIEPGSELRALEQRILDQDPALAVAGERSLLPPALRASTPLVGREAELGGAPSVVGSRRCVAPAARLCYSAPSTVAAPDWPPNSPGASSTTGGWVEYVRGADGFGALVRQAGGEPPLPGVVVDAVTDRCRRGPLLLVVDDAEWMPSAAVAAVEAVWRGRRQLPILVVLIADPSGGGPAIEALRRLPNAVDVDGRSRSPTRSSPGSSSPTGIRSRGRGRTRRRRRWATGRRPA